MIVISIGYNNKQLGNNIMKLQKTKLLIKIYSVLIFFLCMLVADSRLTLKAYAANIVNTRHQKYSYSEMVTDINELCNKYPDYVHANIIGVTADNRNLYEVVLGNPEAPKCIMIQATAHAREYMCSQLVMRQMEYYLDNYDDEYKDETYNDIFDTVCVHVIPMTNPDGVTIAQKGIKGIKNSSLRKKLKKMPGINNPSNWKANARGVDLNNQFNYKFRRNRSLKKYACYAGYGGPYPVSEKESKALLYVVNTYNPKAVVNYHAMGNVIFHNYKGNKATRKKVARLTSKMKKVTGYSYLGTSPGPGFANYLVRKKNIPSATVEIGMYTTPVPISQFKTVWKQNKNLMAAVAQMYE